FVNSIVRRTYFKNEEGRNLAQKDKDETFYLLSKRLNLSEMLKLGEMSKPW
ncbi:12129_t:CDS:1, partial [Dentiscutata heterogama]